MAARVEYNGRPFLQTICRTVATGPGSFSRVRDAIKEEEEEEKKKSSCGPMKKTFDRFRRSHRLIFEKRGERAARGNNSAAGEKVRSFLSDTIFWKEEDITVWMNKPRIAKERRERKKIV